MFGLEGDEELEASIELDLDNWDQLGRYSAPDRRSGSYPKDMK
jgi:hypothetical protein